MLTLHLSLVSNYHGIASMLNVEAMHLLYEFKVY